MMASAPGRPRVGPGSGPGRAKSRTMRAKAPSRDHRTTRSRDGSCAARRPPGHRAGAPRRGIAPAQAVALHVVDAAQHRAAVRPGLGPAPSRRAAAAAPPAPASATPDRPGRPPNPDRMSQPSRRPVNGLVGPEPGRGSPEPPRLAGIAGRAAHAVPRPETLALDQPGMRLGGPREPTPSPRICDEGG